MYASKLQWLQQRQLFEEIPIWMRTPPDFDPCDGLCTHNQRQMLYHSRWSIGKQRLSTCTSRCYGNKTLCYIVCLSKKSLFGWILLLISIPVTACARTINVQCHSTVNGVLENSVQVRAQAVAMATEHPEL